MVFSPFNFKTTFLYDALGVMQMKNETKITRNGVDELKREADDSAIARRIAKEQGY